MKVAALVVFSLLILAADSKQMFGQGKGVDTQTQQIRNQGNGSVPRDSSGTRTNGGRERSFDFGSGKTPSRGLLQNPYRMASKRDQLVIIIADVMRERNLVLDEAASRLESGILISQPYTFAKGAVITSSEMTRFANLPGDEVDDWTRGRYTLTVEVQSIDGVNNNVSVTAKVEGRSVRGVGSEWISLTSSGEAENDFLSALIERVTGASPYESKQPVGRQDLSEKPASKPNDNPQL